VRGDFALLFKTDTSDKDDFTKHIPPKQKRPRLRRAAFYAHKKAVLVLFNDRMALTNCRSLIITDVEEKSKRCFSSVQGNRLRNRRGKSIADSNRDGIVKGPGTALSFTGQGVLYGSVRFQHLHAEFSQSVNNYGGMPKTNMHVVFVEAAIKTPITFWALVSLFFKATILAFFNSISVTI
jgi:hypothetical protein